MKPAPQRLISARKRPRLIQGCGRREASGTYSEASTFRGEAQGAFSTTWSRSPEAVTRNGAKSSTRSLAAVGRTLNAAFDHGWVTTRFMISATLAPITRTRKPASSAEAAAAAAQ